MDSGDKVEKYLTVSKFASFVGISATTLRYYDTLGVFRPAKRGSGEKNKDRLYSSRQITTFNFIRVLTGIGLPLKKIKKLAAGRTDEQLLKLLTKQLDIVDVTVKQLDEARLVLKVRSDLLAEAVCVTENEIFVGEYIRFCSEPYGTAHNGMGFPVCGYFENMEEFLSGPSRPARFFSLDPRGESKKESGPYLVGYTRGYYSHTNGLPERMAAFAKMNKLTFTGPVYNIYLTDEISELNPNNYLLQVSVPVKENYRAKPRLPLIRG